MILAGAFFPGLPSYAVAGAAVGADCARVPPVSHGGFQKNFLFFVACFVALFAHGNLDTSPLPSFLSALVRCLGAVQRIGFFGNACAT